MEKFDFYVRGDCRGLYLALGWFFAAHSGLRAQYLFTNGSLALSIFRDEMRTP